MNTSLTIGCPHCHTRNLVPPQRLGDAPICGQCHEPLFTARPIALDTGNFSIHAEADLPLLVDFWAPWCGPCRMMAPHFEAAAAELEPAVRLAKVNTREQPELAARFSIRSIPTLAMLKRGEDRAQVSGALRTSDIVRWTRDNL